MVHCKLFTNILIDKLRIIGMGYVPIKLWNEDGVPLKNVLGM